MYSLPETLGAIKEHIPNSRMYPPVHLAPGYRERLVGKLADLAAELGVDLVPGHEGMVAQV